jgi:hypothetical protein
MIRRPRRRWQCERRRQASVDRRLARDYDASDADRLGLSVRGRRTTATWPAFGIPGGALSLIPAIKRALAAADVLGPDAHSSTSETASILAVSSDVAESLVRGVGADSSPRMDTIEPDRLPSVPSSQAPTRSVANEVTVTATRRTAYGGPKDLGALTWLGPLVRTGRTGLCSKGRMVQRAVWFERAVVRTGRLVRTAGGE